MAAVLSYLFGSTTFLKNIENSVNWNFNIYVTEKIIAKIICSIISNLHCLFYKWSSHMITNVEQNFHFLGSKLSAEEWNPNISTMQSHNFIIHLKNHVNVHILCMIKFYWPIKHLVRCIYLAAWKTWASPRFQRAPRNIRHPFSTHNERFGGKTRVLHWCIEREK